jgi:hypothetical protein
MEKDEFLVEIDIADFQLLLNLDQSGFLRHLKADETEKRVTKGCSGGKANHVPPVPQK